MEQKEELIAFSFFCSVSESFAHSLDVKEKGKKIARGGRSRTGEANKSNWKVEYLSRYTVNGSRMRLFKYGRIIDVKKQKEKWGEEKQGEVNKSSWKVKYLSRCIHDGSRQF